MSVIFIYWQLDLVLPSFISLESTYLHSSDFFEIIFVGI